MPLWNAVRECQNENHFARPYVSNILQMPTWKMSYKCAHVNIILQTPMWYEVIFSSCNLEIILKMLMWKLFCNKRINKQALHKFQIQRTTGTKSLNSFKRSEIHFANASVKFILEMPIWKSFLWEYYSANASVEFILGMPMWESLFKCWCEIIFANDNMKIILQ